MIKPQSKRIFACSAALAAAAAVYMSSPLLVQAQQLPAAAGPAGAAPATGAPAGGAPAAGARGGGGRGGPQPQTPAQTDL